jgi:hypothetical protein
MWKSIVYKEWLKIRWFLIGFTILAMLGLGYMFLKLEHGFAFSGGKNVWYNILFLGIQFFSYFKFIPLLGGIIIGVTQYFPETVNSRIKLTFHLPLDENKVLLMMHIFGIASLFFSYLILLVALVSLSSIYFPSQMIIESVVSVFPWFLAGFVAYFFVALIVLEPVWIYRVFYTLVAGFFVTIYLKSPMIAAYGPAIPGLLVLTILLSVALLFSAYRFRKGEM